MIRRIGRKWAAVAPGGTVIGRYTLRRQAIKAMADYRSEFQRQRNEIRNGKSEEEREGTDTATGSNT